MTMVNDWRVGCVKIFDFADEFEKFLNFAKDIDSNSELIPVEVSLA